MQRGGISRAFTSAGVVAVLCFAASSPAQAQYTENGWINSAYATATPLTDRQFVKEWEASPAKGHPTLSASNIHLLKAAIKEYMDIVARGGWRPIPEVKQKLQQGASDPAIVLIRERLAMSGELQGGGSASAGFDQGLAEAVKRFQSANGLPPNGIVDKTTIAAMNVPAASRLKQLRTNLTRLGEFAKTPKKYVAVNIPAAQIEAIENDVVVSRHAGVVGKIDRPTPLLKSAIQELNFNAVWHLPPTVIEKDLIPKGQEMSRRGESVLVKYNIDAYGGDGRKLDPMKVNWSTGNAKGLTYKQQPGPENPLGFVKINFPNAHSVYMHDTPSQSLFGRSFRAASSGCVRIAGIESLAAWLVAEKGWRPEHIMQMKETGERFDVRLKTPVPLYFVYITAWATEDGVQFRRDIYQKDGVGPEAGAY
jgi:murein L,D-transpeptidase YcbB/YkuD